MTKRTIIIIASLIIIILLALFGFSKYTTKDTVENVPAVVSKIEKNSSSEKKLEDKNDFYDISIVYPIEIRDKDKAIESFVTSLFAQKKEEWKVGGVAYTAENIVQKKFPERTNIKYQYSVTYKKSDSRKFGTTSYVFTAYEFVGGANGNIKVSTFTFNDKGIVSIDTILDFSKYKDIALTKALADEIIKKDGDQASPDMVLDGLGFSYLKADGKTIDKKKCQCDGFLFPSNFQNFIVEDDGLRFLFNKYQIAPGSAGTPEIMLPWKFLSPYMQSTFDVQ